MLTALGITENQLAAVLKAAKKMTTKRKPGRTL